MSGGVADRAGVRFRFLLQLSDPVLVLPQPRVPLVAHARTSEGSGPITETFIFPIRASRFAGERLMMSLPPNCLFSGILAAWPRPAARPGWPRPRCRRARGARALVLQLEVGRQSEDEARLREQAFHRSAFSLSKSENALCQISLMAGILGMFGAFTFAPCFLAEFVDAPGHHAVQEFQHA